MELLGRVYNVLPTADGVRVNVTGCAQVSFIGIGADTYTIRESLTAGAAGNVLSCITKTYQNAGAAGAAAHTVVTQAVSSAVVSAAALTIIEVNVKAMSDGYKYLSCTSTAAGLVVAICGDLVVQRNPINLAALGV